jgi:hypothetical protein
MTKVAKDESDREGFDATLDTLAREGGGLELDEARPLQPEIDQPGVQRSRIGAHRPRPVPVR